MRRIDDAYGGITSPSHTVATEETIALTITTTNGPCSPSKWQTSRSLRANSRGIAATANGATLKMAPGHVHGFAQRAFQRHVHAVVVARRQVDGGEAAVAVRRGGGLVATEQFGGGVVLALGLEDAPVDDRAGLADAAVGGREQGGRVGVGLARAGFELAREERIEVLVGQRIGLHLASAMFTS
ncbi:hypothetical protein RLIN73S_02511 [Rhodanobacter lindaniclasticus]